VAGAATRLPNNAAAAGSQHQGIKSSARFSGFAGADGFHGVLLFERVAAVAASVGFAAG